MNILEHVSLKGLTTLKIGGTARYFCSVSNVAELVETVSFAKERSISFAVLGGGSNVLITGTEFPGLLIKIDIKGVEWVPLPSPLFRGGSGGGIIVTAGAGENWDALAAEAVRRGLWGIENLSGIPGTVGAAPIQNIGAYGTEIKDVLEWVEAVDAKQGSTLREVRLSLADCKFGYRDSMFKHEGKKLIVTKVAFRLQKNGVPNLEYKDLKNHFALSSYSPFVKGSTAVWQEGFKSSGLRPPPLTKEESEPTLHQIRKAVLEIRSKKFPDLREFGTAGSFFKNPIIPQAQFDALKLKYPDLPGFPVSNFQLSTFNFQLPIKVPLAWILDNICNLKGFQKGNMKLFEKQPIVLVQNGQASAEEVEAFASEVVRAVKEKTGIDVEWEVQRIR